MWITPSTLLKNKQEQNTTHVGLGIRSEIKVYDYECRDLYNRGSSDNDHEFAREFVDPRKNNCVNFSKRHFLS